MLKKIPKTENIEIKEKFEEIKNKLEKTISVKPQES